MLLISSLKKHFMLESHIDELVRLDGNLSLERNSLIKSLW